MNIKDFLKQHPSLNHANDMQDVCKPLKRLGISYFGHVALDTDGKGSGNSSHPEFLNEYMNQGLYNHDLHMCKNMHQQRYVIWDLFSRKGDSEAVYQLGIDFGFCHAFTIIEQEGDIKNFYHFAASNGNDFMNNFYLQQLDLLEKFIAYYKDQMMLKDRLGRAYDLSMEVDDFNSNFIIKEYLPGESNNQVTEFLNLLGIKNDDLSLRPTLSDLPKREWQCAYYLLEGRTSKDIAEQLNLSTRTVEVYFERLKKRFGCNNKLQLVKALVEAKFNNE